MLCLLLLCKIFNVPALARHEGMRKHYSPLSSVSTQNELYMCFVHFADLSNLRTGNFIPVSFYGTGLVVCSPLLDAAAITLPFMRVIALQKALKLPLGLLLVISFQQLKLSLSKHSDNYLQNFGR